MNVLPQFSGSKIKPSKKPARSRLQAQLLSGFLLFHSDDGSSMFVRNDGGHLLQAAFTLLDPEDGDGALPRKSVNFTETSCECLTGSVQVKMIGFCRGDDELPSSVTAGNSGHINHLMMANFSRNMS
jgi:hypothetical protein